MILFIKISLSLSLLLSISGTLHAQPRGAVTVYAAASLKDALDAWLATRNGQRHAAVKAVYAASSTLARQIERGAPADVFISADTAWMDYLAQRKLIAAGSRVNLLSNRLVLIAPANSQQRLAIGPGFPLAAALGNERLAMADPHSVPAGKYGKAALMALGVWRDVSRKVASTDNVRAALMLVARSEAPFGIVYASDAMAEKRVRVAGEFPAHSHPAVVYPAAVVAASRNAGAKVLLDALQSDAARALWLAHGFGMAE